MKMQTLCIKCHKPFYIEIDDDFFQGKKIICPSNHGYYFFPDSPRYPFLFQLSIRAMRNGYYLEAFQALYSGFESFKETFVGASYYYSIKDTKKTEDLMQRLNRSEKIDGAFTLAYLQEFDTLPDKMPRVLVESRNLIIHSGNLPTREFLLKLGNWIFLTVLKTQKNLRKNMK